MLMELILKLLVTILISSCFGLLVNKMKVPGGLLVGAIIGAALLNIFFSTAYMPAQTKLLVQIIAGAFIGCSMEKSDVKRLPQIIKPTIIMITGLLIFLSVIANPTADCVLVYTQFFTYAGR